MVTVVIEQPHKPAPGLNNGHMQTILSSLGRRWYVPEAIADFLKTGAQRDFEVCNGVQLRAVLHTQTQSAPIIILIHGWLGCDRSSYIMSAAHQLFEAGYQVARINLRDHGDTEHLNPVMFNSARIREVVELTRCLQRDYGGAGIGIMGYSLGGNFTLRIARDTGLPALAICPALEPATTMQAIDGSHIYKNYFLQKWRRNLAAKQRAFPELYDFSRAYPLRTVSALTDYFVRYHSDYASTAEYFAQYDLTQAALEGVNAHILMAADDPVIPARQFRKLPSSIEITRCPWGGHGGFVENWGLSSWADRFAIDFFQSAFAARQAPPQLKVV